MGAKMGENGRKWEKMGAEPGMGGGEGEAGGNVGQKWRENLSRDVITKIYHWIPEDRGFCRSYPPLLGDHVDRLRLWTLAKSDLSRGRRRRRQNHDLSANF